MTRLYIADLDDTLLSRGALPPGTDLWLKQVIRSGAQFTVATSRALTAAVAPLCGAQPTLPMIALNGAVTAYANGSFAQIENIAPGMVRPITAFGETIGVAYCLLSTDGINDQIFLPDCTDEFIEWSVGPAGYFRSYSVVRGQSSHAAEQFNITRIAFCGAIAAVQRVAELVKQVRPALSASMTMSRDRPGFCWLEVGSQSATKARATERLASMIGCTMRDVSYYGDAENDLEVMKLCGEAVAVANADARILAVAHRVIASAETGSVLRDLLGRLNIIPETS